MHKASVAASRRMMRDLRGGNLQVTAKGQQILSLRQISQQNALYRKSCKKRPDWGFIMEEAGEVKPADKDAPCWIIDPIDGT